MTRCPTLHSSPSRPALIDGVPVQVALLSPFVQREVLRSGHGVSEDDQVVLPKQVYAALQMSMHVPLLASTPAGSMLMFNLRP